MGTPAEQNKAPPQHTPLPWNAATGISSVVGLPIVSQKGQPVCSVLTVPPGFPNEKVHNAIALANAAFIERACNNHDELLTCLKFMVETYSANNPMADGEISRRSRAAIAAAEARA